MATLYTNTFEVRWQTDVKYFNQFHVSLNGNILYTDIVQVQWEPLMTTLCDPRYINKEVAGELVAYDPTDVDRTTNLPVLPESHRNPWVKVGGVVPTFADSPYKYLRISDTDAGDQINYSRNLAHKIWPGTSFMFEVDLQISENNELGADLTSCIRFFVHDGRMAFGVAIGDSVDLIDTAGLKLAGNPNVSITKTRLNKIRVWKDRNHGIYLYINEELMCSIPWQNAEVVAFTKKFEWGIFDNAGDATFDVFFLQYGSGKDFARPEFFRRTLNVPAKFVKRNQILKGMVRGITQGFQEFKNAASDAKESFKPDVYLIEEDAIKGDVLPDGLIDAWTPSGGETGSIERNSIKIEDSSNADNLQYSWTLADVESHYDIEFYWTLEVHDNWTVAGGAELAHFGPSVEIHDGTKAVHVTWWQDTGRHYVALSNGVISNAVSFAYYGERFVAEPRKEHSFKLFKSRDNEVWLSVDGVIRCVTQYSNFPASASKKIAFGSTTGSESTTWWKNLSWKVSLSGNKIDVCDFIPFASNLILRQRLMDWLIFPSFKETDNELATKMEFAVGIQRTRGTPEGIVRECRWLACSQNVFLLTETFNAGWILEHNDAMEWIFLDSTSFHKETHIDVQMLNTVAYSPSELTRIIKRYIAPQSTREDRWKVNDIYLISAINVGGGVGGRDELVLDRTEYLEAGDEIVIVDKDDASIKETLEVFSVDSTTEISLTNAIETPGNFTAGEDWIRRNWE